MSAQSRALRAEIRHWRRGRANARLIDVLGDAYVAVFVVLMLGSMVGNVVLNLRRIGNQDCLSGGCAEARSLLPWLLGVAGVVAVLGLARLFGPVFVSPAVGSWLLSTPVDRGSLLRPRLLWTALIATSGAGLLAGTAATLGGFSVGMLIAFTSAAALLALSVVCFAALSQAHDGLGSRVLLWLLALVVWAGMALLANRSWPASPPPELSLGWVVGLVAVGLLSMILLIASLRRLGRLSKHQVAPGGSLAPGLSGALATLDLAMVYDVLLAHRWHRHNAVRSRRGGPSGPKALIWCDLTRVRRSPQMLLVLAAAVIVPYAASGVGLGRVVVLFAAFAGFLAGLPFLTALRVVTRTPSLSRMMPFPEATTRLHTLAVPAVLLAAFGLASFPALHSSMDLPGSDALVVGVAVGASALAAATRWVTGRPPDYTKPLVSTPAGGVPTNLYGSAIRGFDVLLITTAPLLISATSTGALFSIVLSMVVLSYLIGRE